MAGEAAVVGHGFVLHGVIGTDLVALATEITLGTHEWEDMSAGVGKVTLMAGALLDGSVGHRGVEVRGVALCGHAPFAEGDLTRRAGGGRHWRERRFRDTADGVCVAVDVESPCQGGDKEREGDAQCDHDASLTS
jgi:hypothetical protein